MSVTESILRVNNLRGVVTSIKDRFTGDKLEAVSIDPETGASLFSDEETRKAYEQKYGKKPITAIPLDVAIRYTPEMSTTITQNPVQMGVNINDHCFNTPDTLTINFGTTDNKSTVARLKGLIVQAQSGWDDIKKNRTPSRALLDLLYRAKEEHTVFQVDDGVHTFSDLIITNISYDKDKTTYRALVATVTLQQFIFVNSDENVGIQRTQPLSVKDSTFSQVAGVLDRIKLVI